MNIYLEKASLTCGFLTVLLMLLACGASDDGGAEAPDDPANSGTGGSPASAAVSPTSAGAVETHGDPFPGGAAAVEELITHPLFSSGSRRGVETADLCARAQLWELAVELDLTTGAMVKVNGTVYEITGVGDRHGYTIEEFQPPCASSWCQEQFGYEVRGSCPLPADAAE